MKNLTSVRVADAGAIYPNISLQVTETHLHSFGQGEASVLPSPAQHTLLYRGATDFYR